MSPDEVVAQVSAGIEWGVTVSILAAGGLLAISLIAWMLHRM